MAILPSPFSSPTSQQTKAQKDIEEIRHLMDEMPPHLWAAVQTALEKNSNNLFKKELTPATEEYYDVFVTIKSLLKNMKVTEISNLDCIQVAKEAIDTWSSLPIPFSVPENHAVQIYMYLQTSMPDPDDMQQTKSAWKKLNDVMLSSGITNTALSADTALLKRTAETLKLRGTGTAIKNLIEKGWVDEHQKVPVPKTAIMGKNFVSADARRKASLQHTTRAAHSILNQDRNELLEVPLHIAALLQDNISLMRHYAIPLLPKNPKEGTRKVCAEVIERLTGIQQLDSRGIDIRHDTAIRIAKQTNLWNFHNEGLLARSVAAHLVLSGNHNTVNLVANMIDYWASHGIQIEENPLMKHGSLIQELYFQTAHSAKEENRPQYPLNRAYFLPSQGKSSYRTALTIIKRLATHASKIGISVPTKQELSRLRQETLTRAAEHTSRSGGRFAAGVRHLEQAFAILEESGIRLPLCTLSDLKTAVSTLADKERESGNVYAAYWCDNLIAATAEVATLLSGDEWQKDILKDAPNQQPNQLRDLVFEVALSKLQEEHIPTVSYLTVQEFADNENARPTSWVSQRVATWTPPSITFNHRIDNLLELDSPLKNPAPSEEQQDSWTANIAF